MSDLQCPATFLVAGPAARPDAGVLVEAGIAALFAEPERLAEAERIAAPISAGVAPIAIADERDPPPWGGALLAKLDELSDLHRGQTCLVLLGRVRPPLGGPGDVVRVRIDADGRTLEAARL